MSYRVHITNAKEVAAGIADDARIAQEFRVETDDSGDNDPRLVIWDDGNMEALVLHGDLTQMRRFADRVTSAITSLLRGYGIPIPTFINELGLGLIVTAMRLPTDPISHESWIVVMAYESGDAGTFSTHLVNFHAEDGRYYASNGHYEIPTLAEATADAIERWNRGV